MEILESKQPIEQVQNPGSASSQLEARVTSDRTPPQTSYGDTIRQQFQPRYGAVRRLYKTVDFLDSKNFSSRLKNCRSDAVFVRHEDTGQVRVRSQHCGLRWCPMCAASRQAWIATETERWFIGVKDPRLVTLTLKHNNLPLLEQITLLYDYFRKFRRRKFFKSHCCGGVWFFHIKKSQNDHRWHPHIHMLIDSDFLDKKEVSREWLKITGDSKIVHVKAVHNPTNSVRHAARYSAEPCDLSGHTDIDALEVFYALDGRRIAGTWGTARSISFRPKPSEDAKKYKPVGSYSWVQTNKDTDEKARAIWKAYHMGTPLAANVSMYESTRELLDVFIHAPPKFDPQGRFNFAA